MPIPADAVRGEPPARWLPDEPLPPYAYLPRRTPHPTRDADGHSFGRAPSLLAPPDPRRWRECTPYLHGIDLFNHGYYWEAHEAWEALWHACGRTGQTADFLRALIRLAAAGFKLREGRPMGALRHAAAASALLREVVAENERPDAGYMGLRVRALADAADGFSAGLSGGGGPPDPMPPDPARPFAVLPFWLRPGP